MSKIKLFIENFLVYGLGGIISKAIPLIMVPIITRIMPNSTYFGISDLATTLLSIGSALSIMGMYDAMYRMFFDKENDEYKKSICSTVLIFTITSSFVISLLMCIFRTTISNLFFGDDKYTYLVLLVAISNFVGATNGIISAPTRMQNKRKVFLIMNTLGPVISYAISIPLLLKGYYVIALPFSSLISGIIAEITFYILNRKWFRIALFKREYLIPLLKIAIPLIPTFLVYWIFNSSDKLMIENILGTSETGIYSVGAKLGHASQLIYTAFAGGWQYFSFFTMNDKDQVKNNSLIFEVLGLISFGCAMLVFVFSSTIYKVLFPAEYYRGYIIAPYLFLAPLLQMLFQVLANQFLIVKKTWPTLLFLSIGAASNVMLNLVLIPRIGIEGAAIATLVGYAISVVLCIVVLEKMKLHKTMHRFMTATFLIMVFAVIWRLLLKTNVIVSLVLALCFIGIYCLLYKDIILFFVSKLTSKGKG